MMKKNVDISTQPSLPINPVSLVVREPLVEKVVSAVAEYISASNLKAGQKLPSETQLATMFGVSRLALREALIRLKALGLIEARHGAGWFVRKFEPADSFRQLSPLLRNFIGADIRQIMQVRMILEPSIAEIAAEQLTEEGIEKLRDYVEKMEATIADRKKFIEWDMSFHFTLANECGNSILSTFCTMLTDLSRSVQWAYRDSNETRMRSLEFHQKVYEAIKNRNDQQAKLAMAQHIQDVWNLIDDEEIQ